MEDIDSREVRTVVIDPVRGPLIRLAFELYATGEYTFEDLSAELYDRGLRTRPTLDRPEQAISDSRLSVLLRDPYYKRIIVFEDEEVGGWHEPLVSPELFDQVQEVIEVRTTAKELRRVHHSYLKGSLFCGGGCRARGLKQRMIMQETTNRHGTTYLYFFCPGRKQGLCETSHIAVAHLEERVENHYATIRFAPRSSPMLGSTSRSPWMISNAASDCCTSSSLASSHPWTRERATCWTWPLTGRCPRTRSRTSFGRYDGSAASWKAAWPTPKPILATAPGSSSWRSGSWKIPRPRTFALMNISGDS